MLQCLAEHGVYRKRAVLEWDRQTIISYLVDVESWTLQEINSLATPSIFWTTTIISSSSKSIQDARILHRYGKRSEIYCALLINLIEYTLKHQQYDAAEVLVVQLKLLATDYKVCKFFQGVLLLRTGDKKQAKRLPQRC